MNVPVGSTTKVGWGAAATAFVGAIVTYLTGDHSAKEVTALELGIGSGVILLVTHTFRYLQALVGLKVPIVSEVAGGLSQGATGMLPGSNEATGQTGPPPGVVADGGDGSQV